jgi:predicted glycoside hydrolase/deacetylase ChbG (UPF0249 family)
MAAERFVIVNADDFGQSPGINRGVIAVHTGGIVTSASLMVRGRAAEEAAALARAHPRLSVGLHVDLGEWACRDGAWITRYEIVPGDDTARVADELERQLAAFRKLLGRDPSHLDSHQHVHQSGPLRPLLTSLGQRLRVPVRQCTSKIRYCGDFYGQTAKGEPYPRGIQVSHLLDILRGLPVGVTELVCHPAEAIDFESMYACERLQELDALCDSRVREALQAARVQLCSFEDFSALR